MKYLHRANLHCDEVWERMLESFREDYPSVARAFRAGGNVTAKAEKGFQTAAQERLLPYLQEEFDNVQYLGAPANQDEPVTAVLRALQGAIYDGEERRIDTPEQLGAVFAEFNQLAQDYGMDHCVTRASRIS